MVVICGAASVIRPLALHVVIKKTVASLIGKNVLYFNLYVLGTAELYLHFCPM